MAAAGILAASRLSRLLLSSLGDFAETPKPVSELSHRLSPPPQVHAAPAAPASSCSSRIDEAEVLEIALMEIEHNRVVKINNGDEAKHRQLVL